MRADHNSPGKAFHIHEANTEKILSPTAATLLQSRGANQEGPPLTIWGNLREWRQPFRYSNPLPLGSPQEGEKSNFSPSLAWLQLEFDGLLPLNLELMNTSSNCYRSIMTSSNLSSMKLPTPHIWSCKLVAITSSWNFHPVHPLLFLWVNRVKPCVSKSPLFQFAPVLTSKQTSRMELVWILRT